MAVTEDGNPIELRGVYRAAERGFLRAGAEKVGYKFDIWFMRAAIMGFCIRGNEMLYAYVEIPVRRTGKERNDRYWEGQAIKIMQWVKKQNPDFFAGRR